MFNPMTPAELISAMGRAARDVARSDDPADPFVRSQLLSVYSASRHVAVELEAFEPELRAFRDAVGLEGADPQALADETCMLLETLRADPSPQASERLAATRAALMALVDREVDLLADAIEGPSR
jgi:hypothetical protein